MIEMILTAWVVFGLLCGILITLQYECSHYKKKLKSDEFVFIIVVLTAMFPAVLGATIYNGFIVPFLKAIVSTVQIKHKEDK